MTRGRGGREIYAPHTSEHEPLPPRHIPLIWDAISGPTQPYIAPNIFHPFVVPACDVGLAEDRLVAHTFFECGDRKGLFVAPSSCTTPKPVGGQGGVFRRKKKPESEEPG